jgi:pyruvate/2-oxoglutarate dehydrogenase complex dihydrolipoamide dehydrogenase (E3) component
VTDVNAMSRRADLLVLGGGAGGLGAAMAARHAGKSVLLVNAGPTGGDCTFTGCVPSKTLLAAAAQGTPFVDAMARVRSTVEDIAATESADVLAADGIPVVDGWGRLRPGGAVEVDGTLFEGDRTVIATGTAPFVPPIPGLDTVEILTNENLFDLREAPASLAILGGGPIGLEMAQAFARFGIPVTLFEAEDRLLPREEPEASALIADVLRRDGVDVRTSSRVERVEKADGGGIRLVDGAGAVVEVEQLLVAVGRRAITDGLDLDAAGVTVGERGYITTSDDLSTSAEGIYAVGDITGRMQLTHAAFEMGRLVAHNAFARRAKRFEARLIPSCTFTSPEIARVGAVESEAAGSKVRVAEWPMSAVDRAVTDGRTDGFVKLISGPKPLIGNRFGGGEVVGATIVADRAGEMIHEAALAMRTKMFTGRLAQTSHAYPTWSMAVQQCAGLFWTEMQGRTARPARTG